MKHIILPNIERPNIERPLVDVISSGHYLLTKRDYRRIYEGHDPGDEDPRLVPNFVCSVDRRRPCAQDPNHFGGHDWQIEPKSYGASPLTSKEIVQARFDLQRAEAVSDMVLRCDGTAATCDDCRIATFGQCSKHGGM